jgi:hypothetical protein
VVLAPLRLQAHSLTTARLPAQHSRSAPPPEQPIDLPKLEPVP